MRFDEFYEVNICEMVNGESSLCVCEEMCGCRVIGVRFGGLSVVDEEVGNCDLRVSVVELGECGVEEFVLFDEGFLICYIVGFFGLESYVCVCDFRDFDYEEEECE